MKLYEIKENSKIYFKEGSYVTFSHMDGMYSFCFDKEDNVINLYALTELEVFEDGYIIVEKKTES